MSILHLENNETTRAALERLLKVENGRFGNYEYLATANINAVTKKLEAGGVRALVLDLGLNTGWDNKHMMEVIRHIVFKEPLGTPKTLFECQSRNVAYAASQNDVPCALLTNYADYLSGDPPLTRAQIQDVFRAEAVFHKSNEGLEACAEWVREKAP